MEIITKFFKYVLIHWGLGLLALLAEDGNAVADLPLWMGFNIIINIAIFIFSVVGFKKFVFKSSRFLNTERVWLSILCSFGVSVLYLLITFIIARLV